MDAMAQRLGLVQGSIAMTAMPMAPDRCPTKGHQWDQTALTKQLCGPLGSVARLARLSLDILPAFNDKDPNRSPAGNMLMLALHRQGQDCLGCARPARHGLARFTAGAAEQWPDLVIAQQN